MSARTITSMTRTRFDELRQDVADGSLARRLSEMVGVDESELTRAQRVELNQARAIVNIYQEDVDLLSWLVREPWREMRLVEKNGKVQVVLKRARG
jgi:hypothetical protein